MAQHELMTYNSSLARTIFLLQNLYNQCHLLCASLQCHSAFSRGRLPTAVVLKTCYSPESRQRQPERAVQLLDISGSSWRFLHYRLPCDTGQSTNFGTGTTCRHLFASFCSLPQPWSWGSWTSIGSQTRLWTAPLLPLQLESQRRLSRATRLLQLKRPSPPNTGTRRISAKQVACISADSGQPFICDECSLTTDAMNTSRGFLACCNADDDESCESVTTCYNYDGFWNPGWGASAAVLAKALYW